MKDFIYQNPNSLSKEECQNIIEIFEEHRDFHYEGVVSQGKNGSINKNIKFTNDLEIMKHFIKTENGREIISLLTNELNNNINDYYSQLDPNNEIFHFNIVHKNKSFYTFLYQKYIKNFGKFTYHNDFHIDEKNNKYRILNYLWYLNDVEEGGETEFFGSYKIKPEAGKMIIFPADWMFPHSGKMPISNDKHIITGWVYVDI